jgi:hypothetical protein
VTEQEELKATYDKLVQLFEGAPFVCFVLDVKNLKMASYKHMDQYLNDYK